MVLFMMMMIWNEYLKTFICSGFDGELFVCTCFITNTEVYSVVAAVPVHEEMSWLNAEANRNIAYIVVTFPVSQLPMSWLNAEAEET